MQFSRQGKVLVFCKIIESLRKAMKFEELAKFVALQHAS